MERFQSDCFPAGHDIGSVEIEARGRTWLVYWLVGEEDALCFMADGSVYVEVVNPHEWQDIHADALLLTADPDLAVDLACERLKRLMHQRGHWEPIKTS